MEFLKILWDNLKKGPVTDPFPFGETYTPERLRGRVEIDPSLCVGCGTCVHVCAAGAINISKFEDGSVFEITVWRNSCCLCAQCRHYCPTKAISVTNNWHSAHRATEKYTQITRAKVKYDYCAVCGAKMRVLPQDVLNRIYAKHSEVDAGKRAGQRSRYRRARNRCRKTADRLERKQNKWHRAAGRPGRERNTRYRAVKEPGWRRTARKTLWKWCWSRHCRRWYRFITRRRREDIPRVPVLLWK